MHAQRPTVTIKRGDTFRRGFSHAIGSNAVDLTGWAISSQVRDQSGALVATLNIGPRNDAAGIYAVSYDNTTTWPIGTLVWDVRTTAPDGLISSTQTIDLVVQPDVTRLA
jgi:hypothetical protein